MAQLVSHIPNLLTITSLCFGFTAIKFAFEGAFAWAVAAVFCAAFFDVADGIAARLLRVRSELGADLDSLADIVNFGIAPAFIIYVRELNALGTPGWLVATVYVVATGLRLARFNVKSRLTATKPGVFEGLPSTLAGVAVLAIDMAARAVFQPEIVPLFDAVLLSVAAALMVSTLPIPTLGRLWQKLRGRA